MRGKLCINSKFSYLSWFWRLNCIKGCIHFHNQHTIWNNIIRKSSWSIAISQIFSYWIVRKSCEEELNHSLILPPSNIKVISIQTLPEYFSGEWLHHMFPSLTAQFFIIRGPWMILARPKENSWGKNILSHQTISLWAAIACVGTMPSVSSYIK